MFFMTVRLDSLQALGYKDREVNITMDGGLIRLGGGYSDYKFTMLYHHNRITCLSLNHKLIISSLF
jgi:hypothetical protein